MNQEPTLIFTEDGSHSLFRADIDETYHSLKGAVNESNHVYVKNGLKQWLKTNSGTPSIFEMGFGTGLNALLTHKAVEDRKISINYTSIDNYPLPKSLWETLNHGELQEASKEFNALHNASWREETKVGKLMLTKIKTDLLKYKFTEKFDVIYFDAFAPAKQPELWHLTILKKCIMALNQNGIFVTYSAKGALKRDLKSLGLKVETLPGPPGKFEMVRATKAD